MALKQIHMLMATLAASTLVSSHAFPKDGDALVLLQHNAENNGGGDNLYLTPVEVPSYLDFLDATFTAALRMMLPANKDTIGGHCFRYAALMAREFYAAAGGPPDLLQVKEMQALGRPALAVEAGRGYLGLKPRCVVSPTSQKQFIPSRWIAHPQPLGWLAVLMVADSPVGSLILDLPPRSHFVLLCLALSLDV